MVVDSVSVFEDYPAPSILMERRNDLSHEVICPFNATRKQLPRVRRGHHALSNEHRD
jgi:hypothetical protein